MSSKLTKKELTKAVVGRQKMSQEKLYFAWCKLVIFFSERIVKKKKGNNPLKRRLFMFQGIMINLFG